MATIDTPTLYLEQDMAAAQLQPFAGGTALAFAARSPDKPTPNEDAVALIPCGPDAGVLVVADGLGGQPAGEQASALALRCLASAVAASDPGGNGLRDAVLDGIEHANRAVTALGVGAATTLAAIAIQGNIARPYHVGDSMILVTGQRGRIKLQTVSHSPVGYAVEAGMLDAEEAMHHAERHLISNMIGSPDMRIEIGAPVRLAPRDTLLVASDGLFDNLLPEEIIARIRAGRLENCGKSLAESCQMRMAASDGEHPGKPDDLSFVLFRPGQLGRNHRA